MFDYSRATQNRAREVISRCRQLATYTEEAGVTTRTFLSAPMRRVHADLAQWMQDAGMQVAIDAVGNIRGVFPGAAADAPRLFIGSHLDTVPHAGAYDGILGVILGIALVAQLEGRSLPFAIEVVGFSEEEGVRFGVPFIGSRALVGTVDDELLAQADRRGVSIETAIRQFGLDPAAIPGARVTSPALGYFEIHIEQGPVLEGLGKPIGVVTAIAGQTRATITLTGASRHAGTTPMTMRRDALACAAEWIQTVEREAASTPGLVGTVGRLDVSPGAGNVIADKCVASLDLRHEDDAVRAKAVARLDALLRHMAARRGIEVRWQTDLDQPAVAMSTGLIRALSTAAEHGAGHVYAMTSGAGHDAMIMASIMPAAMLFVRSPGGLSHHPDESVLAEDVAAALVVGQSFLDYLSVSSVD